MLCHNCGADNPPGRRFCEECGERLATVEHRREKDRTRARRAAAKARIEQEGLTPAEKRRYELRTRKSSSLRIKPGRALAALAIVIIVAVLIVVLVLVFAGSAGGPAKAVQGFLDSLQKRDLAAYLQYTDPVTYAEVQKQGLTLNPDDYFLYAYRISGIKLETVDSKADTAVVKITGGVMEANLMNSAFSTQSLDFSQHPRTVQLAKLEGGWIITNFQEVQLPYELPEQVSPDEAGVEEGL